MARDPLVVLRKVRRHEIDQARLRVQACLAAEAVILEGIRAQDAELCRDREAAAGIQEAYQFLESFALRRGRVRTERCAAEAALATAKDRTNEARNVVVTARTDAEAVEELIGRRAATTQAAANDKAQHALDDIARARFSKSRTGG